MIPRVLVRIILLIYGIILPVYWSHKALKRQDTKETQRWLRYWMIFVLYLKVLSLVDFLVGSWLPFYNEHIILMLLWLVNSELNGSTFLYNVYLEPFLSSYENEIESSIHKIGSTVIEVGLKMSSKIIRFVGGVAVDVLKERNSEASSNRCEINQTGDVGKLNEFFSSAESRRNLNVKRSTEKSSRDRGTQYAANLSEDSSVFLSRNKKVCKSSNPFRSVTSSER